MESLHCAEAQRGVEKRKRGLRTCRHDSNGRWLGAASCSRQSRNPPWYAAAELFVLSTKTGAQRTLFVEHHDQVKAYCQRCAIYRLHPVLVENRLPEHRRQYRAIHGITIDAIRSAHHGGLRRENRCGCALRLYEQRRTPEVSDHSQREEQCSSET